LKQQDEGNDGTSSEDSWKWVEAEKQKEEERLINFLKNGYHFLRHTKKGKRSMYKVFLSEKMDEVLVQKEHSKEVKVVMKVNEIVAVASGLKTQTFKKYGQANELCSFSLISRSGKTLDLETESELRRNDFVAAFNFLVRTEMNQQLINLKIPTKSLPAVPYFKNVK